MTVKDRADRRRIIFAFWLRRMWRLWPSAWLWLGLPLLGLMFFNERRAFGTLAADFAGIFNYANICFAQILMREEIGVSFLYTSLSLEEQLYLLFPLLIVLAPSLGHPATSTGAGRRALICPLPDPYTGFPRHSRTLLSPQPRADLILRLAVDQHRRRAQLPPDRDAPTQVRDLLVGQAPRLTAFRGYAPRIACGLTLLTRVPSC